MTSRKPLVVISAVFVPVVLVLGSIYQLVVAKGGRGLIRDLSGERVILFSSHIFSEVASVTARRLTAGRPNQPSVKGTGCRSARPPRRPWIPPSTACWSNLSRSDRYPSTMSGW